MIRTLLVVGFGSALGGIFRYLLTRFVDSHINHHFTYATMAVNVVGCFLIGLLYALFEKGEVLTEEWRLLLVVGFCGSFTTFSTFAYEGVALMRDGHTLTFVLYTLGSLLFGYLAVYLGYLLFK